MDYISLNIPNYPHKSKTYEGLADNVHSERNAKSFLSMKKSEELRREALENQNNYHFDGKSPFVLLQSDSECEDTNNSTVGKLGPYESYSDFMLNKKFRDIDELSSHTESITSGFSLKGILKNKDDQVPGDKNCISKRVTFSETVLVERVGYDTHDSGDDNLKLGKKQAFSNLNKEEKEPSPDGIWKNSKYNDNLLNVNDGNGGGDADRGADADIPGCHNGADTDASIDEAAATDIAANDDAFSYYGHVTKTADNRATSIDGSHTKASDNDMTDTDEPDTDEADTEVINTVSDVAVPNVVVSNVAVTDASVTDVAVIDATITDAAVTDAAVTDATVTDAAVADLAVAVVAVADVAAVTEVTETNLTDTDAANVYVTDSENDNNGDSGDTGNTNCDIGCEYGDSNNSDNVHGCTIKIVKNECNVKAKVEQKQDDAHAENHIQVKKTAMDVSSVKGNVSDNDRNNLVSIGNANDSTKSPHLHIPGKKTKSNIKKATADFMIVKRSKAPKIENQKKNEDRKKYKLKLLDPIHTEQLMKIQPGPEKLTKTIDHKIDFKRIPKNSLPEIIKIINKKEEKFQTKEKNSPPEIIKIINKKEEMLQIKEKLEPKQSSKNHKTKTGKSKPEEVAEIRRNNGEVSQSLSQQVEIQKKPIIPVQEVAINLLTESKPTNQRTQLATRRPIFKPAATRARRSRSTSRQRYQKKSISSDPSVENNDLPGKLLNIFLKQVLLVFVFLLLLLFCGSLASYYFDWEPFYKALAAVNSKYDIKLLEKIPQVAAAKAMKQSVFKRFFNRLLKHS